MNTPSPNGANGRDRNGRFAPGNAGGPGNPHAQHFAKLRAALLAAAREVLDHTIGRPVQTDLLQRVEELEQRVVVFIPDKWSWAE